MPLSPLMNWLALDGLAEPPRGWIGEIASAGYDGIQFVEPLDPKIVADAVSEGLAVYGSGRVNVPTDADRLAREAKSNGLGCLTLHVGWGMEDNDEGISLIDAVIDASLRHGVPMHVETHRATLFQDIWRTVGFVDKRPELTFNADLSHWYTGLEFVYGGLERKLEFIAPVLDRVEFMHGRIGTPGCMQVSIGERPAAETLPYVEHFRIMWTRAFRSFIQRRGQDVRFPFASELLAPSIYYAREFEGREESDRWHQAVVVTKLARDWFDQTAKQIKAGE